MIRNEDRPEAKFQRLRLKSQQVLLLVALDEHRNLHRAAAVIHTTQPAATASLQQLEERWLELQSQIEAITAALDGGASKAAVCRNFGVARSTLIDTLARIGWTAPVKA